MHYVLKCIHTDIVVCTLIYTHTNLCLDLMALGTLGTLICYTDTPRLVSALVSFVGLL